MAEFKDERVDLSRSAADVLNPGIPAVELKETDPMVIAPLSPDNLTAEDLQKEIDAKKDFYEKENIERSGEAGEEEVKASEESNKRAEELQKVQQQKAVSTSAVDRGQEAVLSPSAEKTVKEAMKPKTPSK